MHIVQAKSMHIVCRHFAFGIMRPVSNAGGLSAARLCKRENNRTGILRAGYLDSVNFFLIQLTSSDAPPVTSSMSVTVLNQRANATQCFCSFGCRHLSITQRMVKVSRELALYGQNSMSFFLPVIISCA